MKLYDPEVSEEDEDIYIAPPVLADYVFNIGDEKKYYNNSSNESPMFTVNKVQILDKLTEINPEYFWDYEKYLEGINEDGTLKDYERSVSRTWEDNEIKDVMETASRKFAYVTLILRNPYDKELKDVGVNPNLEYRKKAADGSLEAFPNDRWGGNDIAGVKEPIYFDQSDYSGSSFFFCDLAPNETKEVNLIFLIDEDHIEDAYITQQGMSVANGVNKFGYYFKVQ